MNLWPDKSLKRMFCGQICGQEDRERSEKDLICLYIRLENNGFRR